MVQKTVSKVTFPRDDGNGLRLFSSMQIKVIQGGMGLVVASIMISSIGKLEERLPCIFILTGLVY